MTDFLDREKLDEDGNPSWDSPTEPDNADLLAYQAPDVEPMTDKELDDLINSCRMKSRLNRVRD
jgi:hypothetical protein